LPALEAFLELGRELHRARLGSFISDAITSRSIEASTARGLLDAATRYHEERRDAEERARLDDEGHARKLLAQIAVDNRWLHVRDEIGKLARLALAQRDARRPLESGPPGHLRLRARQGQPMTGKQIKELRDALCSAFTQDSLDEMLRLQL